ncbi:hypothetical protein [Actinoplanes regularis]|uniref:Uncharacterized protein n=1 Tax=Actinoplanes regularis TaxID=52697 RepID=A0A239C389_9ACTN|nr:hypothetical protein [Actinoplanes regularis]GIE88147.1 hypothetical protein Are01nite_46270 [Actinoplanes regularis]SNS14389.1 hypothetical protein SAMN06264365_110268 [Actinoplanes regularis]
MTTEKTMTAAREAVRRSGDCGCEGTSSGAVAKLYPAACGCGGSSGGCGGGCDSAAARERPRWFAGQLVGPRDLTDTQVWVLERMRRHNRLLHGWGVDCGLTVAPALDTAGRPVPWQVKVTAGHALAPGGDEILVETATTVDVRAGEPGAGGGPLDPWCAPVRQRRDPGATYYLAVRYDEAMTRPVRTASCGCGCDDETACEYSRIAEGAAFALLDALPPAYTKQAGGSADDRLQEAVACTASIREHGSRQCPDCACSPWVVLADITVTGRGAVTVDQLANRRFLASFGNYGFFCPPRSLGCMEVIRINRNQEGPEAALVEAFMAGNTAAVDKLIATGLGVLGTVPLSVDGPDAAAVQQVTSQVLDIVQNRVAEDSIMWLAESWPERSGQGKVVADSTATAILDGATFAGNRQPDQVVGFTGSCGARLLVVSVPKATPPPLRITEVTIAFDSDAEARLTDPSEEIVVNVNQFPIGFRIGFDRAVAGDSVTTFESAPPEASSLLVNLVNVDGTTTPVSGQFSLDSATVGFWRYAGVGVGGVMPPGSYRVTAFGDPQPDTGRPAISAAESGRRLDGEPTGLPSGNGTEGGDFTFTMFIFGIG